MPDTQPQSPLQQPPKTHSERNWLIFIFLLFVVGVAMVWFYLNNSASITSNGNFAEKKTVKAQAPAVDQFAGWKTYTLDPIAFRYPPAWIVTNPATTSVGVSDHTLKPNSEDVATVTFNLSSLADLDYKHVGVTTLADFLTKYSQGTDAQVMNYKVGQVGKLSGYSATLNGFSSLDAWYTTLKDGRILEITSASQQDSAVTKVVSSLQYAK